MTGYIAVLGPPPTRPPKFPSTMDQLAAIPDEDIWFAKQKSARARRASRLDARRFLAALDIIYVPIAR